MWTSILYFREIVVLECSILCWVVVEQLKSSFRCCVVELMLNILAIKINILTRILLTSLAPSSYRDFNMSKLKSNVKRASAISKIFGLQWFKCLWWHLAFEHASFDLKSKCLWYTAEHALKIELSLFLHESDSCRLNLSCYWQDFHINDSKSTLERSIIFKIPKNFKVLSPKGLAVMSRPLLNRGSLVRLYIRRSFVGLFMIIRVRITRLHTNSKLNTS